MLSIVTGVVFSLFMGMIVNLDVLVLIFHFVSYWLIDSIARWVSFAIMRCDFPG